MTHSKWQTKPFDVVACGAGSAGCAAAYGAALAGARTLLVERLGFCGGTPVAAAIHTLDAVRSCQDYSQRVVGGFATELWKELVAIGGLATEDNPPEADSFNPEFMKVAIHRVLQRAGVEILYQAVVVDALKEPDRITGVELALLDGRAQVKAKVVVDGTGDAAVACFAGAEWVLDEGLQALTYHFRLGGVAPGPNWESLETECRNAMRQLAPAEFRYGGPWLIRLAGGEISVNATRVYGNPVDPAERSRAEAEARESMLQIAALLKRGVPALRDSYVVAGATELHVRESRKIVGDYIFTQEDIWSGRKFKDVIAIGAWPVDIHPTDGFVGVHEHKESPPEPYEIPYRCLLPKGVENLLVAGKPISTTHDAHGSTRVPGTSMATGHAAGVAAGIAALSGVTPRRVDVRAVQARLREQGAILSLPERVRQ